MSQEIDYDNINLDEIDFDKIDYSDTDFLRPLIQKSPLPALTIFPIEIWTQIVSYVNDIQTLKSLILTCTILREILKEPLMTQMVKCEPLNKLFELTEECMRKEKNDDKENQKIDIKEIIFKMHKYVDKVVYSESEPSKWTDDIFEWDGYNEKLDFSTNQEAFRREVGRRGKARAKAYIEWELKVENEKKILKRELAKCWAVSGKMFPFSHAENREWKRRRQERSTSDQDSSLMPKENKAPRQPKQHQQSTKTCGVSKNSPQPRLSKQKHHEKENAQTSGSWKFSHEIRNQSKPKRPNIGKGEEEYNKKILTAHVTPTHFNNGASFEGLPHDVLTNVMLKMLKRFYGSNERVLKFPSDLSGYQRKQLHRQAELLGGLKTISFGEGAGRFLVVMREDVEIME
ncbi:16851_t:CDS:2 [Dentiscutata erythropus]|uniref:16851_t:CDS:1 n=1 Tax=Dentiscutata erythropus TaxID=1348616 RepID=A0A9N9ACN5_9GLOM|nr:16851_t:CDS:2 [Dentiscutata erythropus]